MTESVQVQMAWGICKAGWSRMIVLRTMRRGIEHGQGDEGVPSLSAGLGACRPPIDESGQQWIRANERWTRARLRTSRDFERGSILFMCRWAIG